MPITYGGDNITFNDGSRVTSAYTGFKNRIINGGMVFDQRNAGASVTASATATYTYTLDRWFYVVSQASKMTVQQNAGSVTPPVGFNNYLGVTSSSAYSVGTNDYFVVGQKIEGFNFADLGWGTANAKTVTLSFWVRSSLTGTFGGVFRNGNDDRTYAFTYTISSANTWEQKSVTVAGDTTGTWAGATNGVAVQIFFGLGLGASQSISAGSWTAGSYGGATGATSVVGTNGATFYITGVQLEVGSSASTFDYRPYSAELNLCHRYCWVLAGNGLYYPRQHIDAVSSSTGIWYVQYPAAFRALPSLTTKNVSSSTIEMSNHANGAAPSLTSVTFGESAFQSGFVNMIAASGFTAGGTGHWRWIGGPDANFTFSAEL